MTKWSSKIKIIIAKRQYSRTLEIVTDYHQLILLDVREVALISELILNEISTIKKKFTGFSFVNSSSKFDTSLSFRTVGSNGGRSFLVSRSSHCRRRKNWWHITSSASASEAPNRLSGVLLSNRRINEIACTDKCRGYLRSFISFNLMPILSDNTETHGFKTKGLLQWVCISVGIRSKQKVICHTWLHR